MKYFVTSDIHSFYSIFKSALDKAGFDKSNPEQKLIICGDLFDRGEESKELLNYLYGLPKDKLILIRGNHEDLMEDCLFQLEQGINISYHHYSNKTVDTIAQLSKYNKYDLACGCFKYSTIKSRMSKYFELISRTVDYFETEHYIFVHGWIPVATEDIYYTKNSNWRKASDKEWNEARWFNGMDMAHNGIIEDNKTIVCGHWHCSYGNYTYHNLGKDQYDVNTPYKDKGILAIDACTALSKQVNIEVIED